MTTTTSTDFAVEIFEGNPGYNRPQKLGRALWAPMWVMALMGFAGGIVVAGIRAYSIASGSAESTIQAQAHLGTALMFVGFAGVFAAISFAVARILGAFRDGAGRVQETVGVPVQILKMPRTARAFILSMVMAMMTLVVAVIIHFVAAAGTANGDISLADTETIAIVLEGVRRLGVSIYLVAIALGLATITRLLRYQAIRLRELPSLIHNS